MQSKMAVLDTGKTIETFFQPEFLSILIVVTEIIPSKTVAITIKTHVEVKKDIPIPTTVKTTSAPIPELTDRKVSRKMEREGAELWNRK